MSAAAADGVRVERWSSAPRALPALAIVLAAALALVPFLAGANAIQKLTSLFILGLLAAMWNALAGYGGLVSVGQQAYIGVGAYGTIYLANHGVEPYTAMLGGTLIAGAIAVPTSLLLLRWRGGHFAIASWVVAEVFAILVSLDESLGAGTGTSLIELNRYAPEDRRAYTYWLALGAMTLFLALQFLLLRSHLGTSLQAIRDDEDAAASLGVRVLAGKWTLYMLAAVGCGAAGALILANTLFVQPTSIFGIQWTAYMVFMVLVGGLGTFEGPLVGAVVLFAVQDWFADYGVWYLVGLGVAAIVIALLLPRGVWGTVEERFGIRLLPVGYRVRGLRSRRHLAQGP
jgi:branched-chain amino acid transport system permease protein